MLKKTGFTLIALALLGAGIAVYCAKGEEKTEFTVSALPTSVRLDPVSGRIIEDRPDIYQMEPLGDLLERNWIYDGGKVSLHASRGEYVSFQVVVGLEAEEDTLRDLNVEMTPFASSTGKIEINPELFLEWSVKVLTKSSGYELASYGPGWYPDALIPFTCLQIDPKKPGNSLIYPLSLPDFRNRIEGQRYQMIWVDQWIPLERGQAAPGVYRSMVTVTADGTVKTIPVELTVWDFALPKENNLWGNFQHEGFMKGLEPALELKVYQLLRRNRLVAVDPNYRPALEMSKDGKVNIDWTEYDSRLKKYLTGEAFTAKDGYAYGPGYGEPLELYLLPFDCYSEHRGRIKRGWPDISTDKEERKPEIQAVYLETIRQVREHLLALLNPTRTHLVVFLNGLDESYYPEAWERMVYYGNLFKEHFPEAKHRVDGGYSEEAMKVIHGAIDYWCCHSVGYNMETVEAYRKLGIQDWVYGPVLYEREGNSGVGSSTFTDLELSNERAMSWACWKYRTLTWCSWGIASQWNAAWYSPETWKHASRQEGEPSRWRAYNGNALEVYPPGIVPGVNEPCPTVRLKNARDGVEEYEMFRLLAGLDGSPARADSIANGIVYQPFGDQSVGRFDVWSHDPRKWDAARIELGELIEKATAGK